MWSLLLIFVCKRLKYADTAGEGGSKRPLCMVPYLQDHSTEMLHYDHYIFGSSSRFNGESVLSSTRIDDDTISVFNQPFPHDTGIYILLH